MGLQRRKTKPSGIYMLQINLLYWKSKIIYFFQSIKGEFYCRFFHRPLFYNFIGVKCGRKGGVSYYRYTCYRCNNSWESYRIPRYESDPMERKRVNKILKENKNELY